MSTQARLVEAVRPSTSASYLPVQFIQTIPTSTAANGSAKVVKRQKQDFQQLQAAPYNQMVIQDGQQLQQVILLQPPGGDGTYQFIEMPTDNVIQFGTDAIIPATNGGTPTYVQTPDGQQIQVILDGSNFVTQAAPIACAQAASSATAPTLPADKQAGLETVYVNPKQYTRIMHRRETRARLEMDGKISKERKKYLHESRHKHAIKRVRGVGGKFDSTDSAVSITSNNSVTESTSETNVKPQESEDVSQNAGNALATGSVDNKSVNGSHPIKSTETKPSLTQVQTS